MSSGLDSSISLSGRRWLIIGAGRLGTALAEILPNADVWTRSEERAAQSSLALNRTVAFGPAPHGSYDAVFVAVSDAAIARVSFACNETIDAPIWLHGSGCLLASELRVTPRASVGSVHPLQSLQGDGDDLRRLQGAFFALEGDDTAVQLGAELVEAFGGVSARLASDTKPAYHAAAVLASNGVYGLLRGAYDLCARNGLDTPALRSGLANLSLGSAQAAVSRGVEAAATGPVVRGDAKTVDAHMNQLRKSADHLRALYVALSEQLLAIAEERDLSPREIAALQNVLYAEPE